MTGMAKTKTRAPSPVSSTYLPVVRCALCPRTLPHQPRPGAAAAVLTEHQNRDHAAELARAATGHAGTITL
jgi:hypothetical protein